jgi:hypothetical protein
MEWTDERVLVSLPKFAQMVDRKPSLEAAMEAHPEYADRLKNTGRKRQSVSNIWAARLRISSGKYLSARQSP